MTLLDERPATITEPDLPDPAGEPEHRLRFTSRAGDVAVTWRPGNQTEEQAARATFDKLRGQGYAAYTVDGDDRSQIRRFDAEAGEIVMVTPLQGG